MIPIKHALAGLGAVLAMTVATSAMAQKTVVGVSWSNFQEERWKTDEAAIKARLTELGADYISADAQSSPSKQLADVESLISRGATALIVLAQDNNAIMPAIARTAKLTPRTKLASGISSSDIRFNRMMPINWTRPSAMKSKAVMT